MSNVNLFNGATITIEGTETSYHTYDDWGLYITNTDCIGEPIQDTHYVEVMGANRKVDLSEALTGHITYKSRAINIELAGVKNKVNWDVIISDFRNKINGRVCRITFDNDITHFWRGRVSIKDFSSIMRLGTFKISIPEADPYKYNQLSSIEPWKWNPFNFLTDIVTNPEPIDIDGTHIMTIPSGNMYVAPTFICTVADGDSLTVTDGRTTVSLRNGTNYDPRIRVNGFEEVTLTFEGKGSVKVDYRGGSL